MRGTSGPPARPGLPRDAHETSTRRREGKAGIALAVPATPGPGVIVSGLQAGGAGQMAGLVVGDRLLAINGLMLTSDHERVSEQIRSSGEEVRLVAAPCRLVLT